MKNKDNNEKKYQKMLTQIDNIELIPNKEIKNMDFYELAYYMQTLNLIDSLQDIKEDC